MVQQLHDVVLVVPVLLPKQAEQLPLDLRLHHEGLLGLDDLDRHVHARVPILRPDDLAEGALPYPLLDLVALVQDLPRLDDVVPVLVVVAVVVDPVALSIDQGILERPLRVVYAVDHLAPSQPGSAPKHRALRTARERLTL
eukprot:scaffold347_cov239-Pinguiococcus_pyrenoidosus.AAC.8